MVASLISVSIVPIELSEKEDVSIYLSSRIFKKWNIKTNTVIHLKIGQKTREALIKSAEIPPTELQIPERFLMEFAMPTYSGKYLIKYSSQSRTITVGPFIGLLTDLQIDEENEPDFRSVHAFCEELHHGISGRGGFFSVFSLQDLSNEFIKGYYFKDGKWVLGELPIPSVIYNRIHSRKLEYQDLFLQFYEQVVSMDIPFFNHRFLSKWEVYSLLIKEEYMHPYIPKTKIFSKESLREFINKYDTVFVKPIHGSQGRNIIKIKKEEDYFSIQSSVMPASDNSVKKDTIEAVLQHLKKILHNRIYIIQQGIPLADYQSRPMDFRVLCHKNVQNLWEVTSLIARISGEKQFVSNIARGGEIMKPLSALSAFFNKENSLDVISLMKELSVEASSILSSHSAGITGELGVDIGIDINGKLWLIEVNSKPSKNFEDHGLKIRPSAKAIINFGTSLAFNTFLEKEEQ